MLATDRELGEFEEEIQIKQMGGCPVPTRVTVSGFPRYSNSVSSLRESDQAKLRHIRSLILRSLQTSCRPLLRVRIVGHADIDVQRERREPGFMVRMSRQRALAVRAALERLINNAAISSRIAWEIYGAGASQLVVPNPTTEDARRRNRRVDVSISAVGRPPDPWAFAVQENRRYMRSLGWQAYASAIMRLIGFSPYRPSEPAFAAAIARWQTQQGLAANGIIESRTLQRIRKSLLGSQASMVRSMRPSAATQEIPPDPGVMKSLQREFRSEAGDEADRFVTEQVGGIPAGHKRLTELASSGLPITSTEREALKDGNARVDDIGKVLDPAEQRRHTLRRTKCQPVPDALAEARAHLNTLHSLAIGAPARTTQFEWLGEALHLIRDSYSDAHSERRRVAGRGLPIVFIRFYGFGSCQYPNEHQVPADPRDCITTNCIPLAIGGTLTAWSREAVSASREYLVMALRHIASPGSPSIPTDLLAFMDKHLSLHPAYTPTIKFYPHCPDPGAPCSP